MSSTYPSLDFPFQHLRQVRAALLRLHKALLHSERDVYERFHGRIQSKGEFFQLVVGDEWFSWLRPFSQFIVQIDEALNAKEPITLDRANELLDEARSLVSPAEKGTLREQRYYQAIQRDPDIAFMHAEVSSLLATK
ncbi:MULTISPECIES: hypothetical protein [unclassified Coleofasciculus]|uniref:hypothetical protein n=1 Tax=unclassified Coleofasciculus TaxID=2692782 RepID=UPI001882B6D3|nr:MULTISPECIES: hypothetical protein [unclassified Coleofasciculus]MBE9125426.1 hypothetical protein [Coleofasciculus sp. LEGE 07081]MBE9147112.1 hypothetical protein [Coleofasciculus sp. LEGE 07092]